MKGRAPMAFTTDHILYHSDHLLPIFNLLYSGTSFPGFWLDTISGDTYKRRINRMNYSLCCYN